MSYTLKGKIVKHLKTKTGEEIPDNELDLPLEPSGEEWAEEDELAKRFPKVWARFGKKA